MPTCRHCSQAFEITTQDKELLEKVSPVIGRTKQMIPAPTLCPECRQQRRLAFRNERHLYHRKCDRTGKQIISMYSQDKPFKVYDHHEWWSDAWDALSFGRPIDEQQPVFPQLQNLMLSVPRRSLAFFQNENSDYTNMCSCNKDCYLLFSSDYCEQCSYVSYLQNSRSCYDCMMGSGNELCYECFHTLSCFSCKYCIDVRRCSDCAFCMDCADCDQCTLCTGLRNRRYYFMNEQCSPEEYGKKVASLREGKYSSYVEAMQAFEELHRVYPRCGFHFVSTDDCSGDYLSQCQHCHSSFNVRDSQDCIRVFDAVQCKDCQDCDEVGYSEICYEELEGFPKSYNVQFSYHISESSDLLYCDSCYNSSHLFGCVGLKKKQYCILNKQYPKEEYETLVPRIIDQMRTTGEWGEFFPITLSTFCYNETTASEYFPVTKQAAKERGWQWHDEENPRDRYLGPPLDIPDSIQEVPDSITKQILRCCITDKPYKIIPQELNFYRQMHIPIPRKCPDQRHKERLAIRNPRKLWNRACAKCKKAIATSYAPERPETVYCEACYLATVY
jgi:hypothetical protein